jgi:pimeloyl-ACP methyl ester carboxylesterase
MSSKLSATVLSLIAGVALMADSLKVEQVEINGTKGIERLRFKSPLDGVEDFALALPPKGGSAIWIVNIHGHGSKGDQLFTRPDIKAKWLPVFIERGFGILTPNVRGNSWMGEAAAADLHGLLQTVRERYGVKGFIFVGGSMGGTSSLIYASLHPEDVMACVALCPATDLPSFRDFAGAQQAPVMKEIAAAIDSAYSSDRAKMQAHSALLRFERLKMPLYIVHASDDPIIPVAQSRLLAKAMAGSPDFKYIEIPGGHDSPLPFAPEGLAWVCERMRGL